MKNDLNYDLNNDDFVNFFMDSTGYMIRRCQCGWEEVVSNLANPTKKIDPSSWVYLSGHDKGLPVSTEDAQGTIKCWMITRSKLQKAWETFNRIYPQKPVQFSLI